MIRSLLGLALLFLVPTAVYLGYTLLTRPARAAREAIDEAPFVWLGLSGAALVLGTLIYYSSTSTMGGRNQTYTPAKIKDGQIEPGHFQ